MLSQRNLARLEEISQLEDGWCNGRGKGPDSETIRKAREFGERLLAENFTLGEPDFTPYLDGRICLEWGRGETYWWCEASREGIAMTVVGTKLKYKDAASAAQALVSLSEMTQEQQQEFVSGRLDY